MLAIKSRGFVLALCFLVVSFLLVAQTIGNALVVVAALGCFLLLVAGTTFKGFAVPVLLFFLPFSSVIKFRPGMISFYTIALLAVYVIYMVLGSKNIAVYHVIPGLVLIAIALVVKTFNGYAFGNSFILFALSILLMPFITREIDDKYDFFWLTVFFSAGMLFAAFTSEFLTAFPTILRFFAVVSQSGIIRLSGFYGDPNFYSAHFTAAIAGFLILLLKNKSKRRSFFMVIMLMLLLYYGLKSVSKTFIVITACLLLFWLLAFFFQKGHMSDKVMIIICFAVGVVFFLSSTVFTDMIDSSLGRFQSDKNWSDVTTGRTELWMQYLEGFINDPWLFLFGTGGTNILLGDKSSHNTIIQGVYQFGLIGSICIVGWLICFAKNMISGIKYSMDHIPKIFLLLVGAFGPWMALDFVFFDEFFLIPIYVCVGIKCLTDTEITSIN